MTYQFKFYQKEVADLAREREREGDRGQGTQCRKEARGPLNLLCGD